METKIDIVDAVATTGLVDIAPNPLPARRKTKKPGRKPWTPTEKILDRIYNMVLKGKTYHNEIYTKLGIGKDAFYNALPLYPEIQETIDQAKSDRMELVLERYDDIIMDPTHKKHAEMVRHAIDRHDKQNQRVEVNHNITVRPYQEKSEVELLDELTSDD